MKKILFIIFTFFVTIAGAQTLQSDFQNGQKYRKSTEIGIGIDMHNINRIGFQNYTSSTDGDRYKLHIRNAMLGGNIYLARELKPWLFIDLQGTIGMAEAFDGTDAGVDKNKLFAMLGPGIQFRLTPLFKGKYVEPYFRAGVNYYYKDFWVSRSNKIVNFEGNHLEWTHTDEFNKNVDTKKEFFPFAFGFGVNSWFNDRVGFGIQGDYVTSFNNKSVSFPRVQARIMVRFGSSKEKKTTKIQYIERTVIKEVPVEKIVEKVVENKVEIKQVEDPLIVLLSNINFDFNNSTLTPESSKILDEAAIILKDIADKKFLISGFTDNQGSVEYNKSLSEKRAQAVVKGLIDRGVPVDMLKSRGVGKSAASMPASESEKVREGDRKVTIELIKNMEYWHKLP